MTVQHIVMLEFNDGVDERVDSLKAVEGLKDKIDRSRSDRQGFLRPCRQFTHAVIVTMRDREVLSAYGPPAHKEVQGLLGPVVKTLWVIDFEPS